MLGQCTVVVPTIGRPSLDVLLDALAAGSGPRPAELLIVDDRPTGAPLNPDRPGLPPVRVVRTGGGGPARARALALQREEDFFDAVRHARTRRQASQPLARRSHAGQTPQP